MGKNHKRKDKSQKRCTVSNKLVTNKDVVIVDYAIDYVKMMGFEVRRVNPQVVIQKFLISLFAILFIFLTLTPFVSAQTTTDVLNGDGSFDNLSQYNNWTISEIGMGNTIHFSELCFLRNCTRAITEAGTNKTYSSNISYSFDAIENSEAILSLVWRKGAYPVGTIPQFHIMSVILVYPDNSIQTIWTETSNTSQNFFLGQKNVSDYFTQTGTYTLILFSNIRTHTSTSSTFSNSFDEVKLYISPYVEPEPKGIFYIDFNKTINIVLIGILILFSIALYLLKKPEWSAFILIFLGFMFLFNDINIMISVIVIAIGVILAFMKGGVNE